MDNKKEQGQSLLELIVVIAVGTVIITAIVFSSISSLRNNQLAKNQAQATRLAQEGLEKIRIARDRNQTIAGFPFSSLWINTYTCPANCYFKFDSGGQLVTTSATQQEVFTTGSDLEPFKRLVIIEEPSSGASSIEQKFTVTVTWTDFAGPHESKQTTILRKI
jgi:type II secretory pathway pseudopilin PulG